MPRLHKTTPYPGLALAGATLALTSTAGLAATSSHTSLYYQDATSAQSACQAQISLPYPSCNQDGVVEYRDCRAIAPLPSTQLGEYVALIDRYTETTPGNCNNYESISYTHNVYRDPACPTGTEFVGDTASDCLNTAFVSYADSSQKQLGLTRSSCTIAGNPCDAATGNKYQLEEDWPGGNGIPGFSRSFNSMFLSTVGFGTGWTHPYARRIDASSTGAAVRLEDGRLVTFALVNGAWVAPADESLTLVQTPSGFTLSYPDGRSDQYAPDGRLLSATSATGQTTTLTYDTASGNLFKVTGPFGHVLEFNWSTSGRISALKLPDTKTISYTYDTLGRLTQVSYPGYFTRKYLYANSSYPRLLTGITDELGNTLATYAYGTDGRAASTQHAGGAGRFDFTYGSGTSTVSNGSTTLYSFDLSTNLGITLPTKRTWPNGSYATWTWNSSNRPLTFTDEIGRSTTYTWDSNNRQTSITLPDGSTRSMTYLGALDLPTSITAPSVAAGQLVTTSINYDAGNRPTQISVSGFTPSGTPVSRQVTMAWTTTGQLASITDAMNRTATLTYWNCTTGGACGQLASIIDPLNRTTTFDTYDTAGRLTQETAPDGAVTTYTYDTRGNLATVVEKAGSPLQTRTTSFTWNGARKLTKITFPDSTTATFAYDAAQRLTSITDGLGNKQAFTLDAAGNVTVTEAKNSANTTQYQLQRAFDLQNRLTSITQLGNSTSLAYDNASQLQSVTDPLNRTESYTRNLLGRVTRITDPASGQTDLTYTPAGEVSGVTAPNGAATTYQVDDLGQVLAEVSADRGTVSKTYDAVGNVLTVTDARGVVRSTTYDALNRPTQVTYTGGATVTYTWDTCRIGKLCQVQDGAGTRTYDYDAFGRVKSQVWAPTGGGTFTTAYTWNAYDRLTKIDLPTGRSVTITRDLAGRVKQVNTNSALVLANRTYRADGTLATQGWGNGLSETRSYDLAGQLTTWNLGTPENRTLTYDAVGNILTISGSLGATYGYDSLDRLTSETGTGITQSFTWDGNGNRLSDGAGGYSYAPNTNREVSSPQGAVVVDGAGYTTSDRGGARSFTWSPAGDMATATMSGTTATYTYRDDHLRASKTVGGNTTLYHYDLNGRLIAETTAAGAVIREYVWDDDAPVAQVTGGVLAYLHTDQIGTPRLATNAAKTVVWRWNGKAFGESAPAVGTVTVNLRFPGQYFDAETGLHYNWHRYYDPAAGRYLSSDPIGVEGGINTFGYVGGNPVSLIDPQGLWAVNSIGGVAGLVTGGIGGYISSGGNWQATLQGAAVGGAIGLLSPASALGTLAGGVLASATGQVLGNLGNPCSDNPWAVDWRLAAVAGSGALGGRVLAGYLSSTTRSASSFVLSKGLGPASPVAQKGFGWFVEGSAGGWAEYGANKLQATGTCGCP